MPCLPAARPGQRQLREFDLPRCARKGYLGGKMACTAASPGGVAAIRQVSVSYCVPKHARHAIQKTLLTAEPVAPRLGMSKLFRSRRRAARLLGRASSSACAATSSCTHGAARIAAIFLGLTQALLFLGARQFSALVCCTRCGTFLFRRRFAFARIVRDRSTRKRERDCGCCGDV